MNCLINTIDFENIDLLSNSMIISLFLLIFNIIKFFFIDILAISEQALIFFQFILGLLPFAPLIINFVFGMICLLMISCFRCEFGWCCCED